MRFVPRQHHPAPMKHHFLALLALSLLALAASAFAHPITFNSTITYSAAQPSGAADSVAQWSGAAFDAANIGGSGVNADGGANNGTANDASTRVAGPPGADLHDREQRQWLRGERHHRAPRGLHEQHGDRRQPTFLEPRAHELADHGDRRQGERHDAFAPVDPELHAGRRGQSRRRQQRERAGHLHHLQPAVSGPPRSQHDLLLRPEQLAASFEWLGTSSDPYAGGTAYSRSGSTITPLSGDRVFQVNMTASAAPYAPFAIRAPCTRRPTSTA